MQKDAHFIYKIHILKECRNQSFYRLKNYMPAICVKIFKTQTTKELRIKASFKRSCALTLIDANAGILNNSKIPVRWQSKKWLQRCFRVLQLVQATYNLKRSAKKFFWFLFMLLVNFIYIFK